MPRTVTPLACWLGLINDVNSEESSLSHLGCRKHLAQSRANSLDVLLQATPAGIMSRTPRSSVRWTPESSLGAARHLAVAVATA